MPDYYQNYLEYLNHQFVAPSNALAIEGGRLRWHGIDVLQQAQALSGNAFVTYLPAIRERAGAARQWIRSAIGRTERPITHSYYVSIKANYWPWAMRAAVGDSAGLEISGPNDLQLVEAYIRRGFLPRGIRLMVNGVKPLGFRQRLLRAIREDIVQPYIVADSVEEVQWYADHAQTPLTIGIRMKPAARPPDMAESRFGIHADAIEPLMDDIVLPADNLSVDAIHIQSYGTTPEGGCSFAYYTEAIARFVALKAQYPSLAQLNFGGGLFSHVYPPGQANVENAALIRRMIDTLVSQCDNAGVPIPGVITELGAFNYALATVFLTRTTTHKSARTHSDWLFVEGSIMNDLPDTLLLSQHPFVPMALSHFEAPVKRYRLAGLTCDPMDWLDSTESEGIALPQTHEPLPLAMFNCGAYQATLSGYGGLRHCMLDHPHQVFLDTDASGELFTVAHISAKPATDVLLGMT